MDVIKASTLRIFYVSRQNTEDLWANVTNPLQTVLEIKSNEFFLVYE